MKVTEGNASEQYEGSVKCKGLEARLLVISDIIILARIAGAAGEEGVTCLKRRVGTNKGVPDIWSQPNC